MIEGGDMTKQTSKSATQITEITSKIVKLLTPLDSAARQRAIQATLTIFGDVATQDNTATAATGSGKTETHGASGGSTVQGKAAAWMRQNDISEAQLAETFDVDGENTSVIADTIPGKNAKDRTASAYVIQGIARLLATGEATFDDKAARKLCEHFGCYDASNHAGYLGGLGNRVAGSKSKGWKLTAPGMKAGADLVKAIAQG